MQIENNLEIAINQFGLDAFARIKKHQRQRFSMPGLCSGIMNLTMKYPKMKASLFRLVDVLPSLKTDAAAVEHINQYLIDGNSNLPAWLKALIRTKPRSLRGLIASRVNRFAVYQMAKIFIAGTAAESALPELKSILQKQLAFTVDLLGEYSLSEVEAVAYQQRYLEAINTLKQNQGLLLNIGQANAAFKHHRLAANQLSVSIKLSALYSQTSTLNFKKSVEVLSARLSTILRATVGAPISIYLDAEDTGTNPIIVEVFKKIFLSEEFRDFPYPGIVLQAYSRESEALLLDLINFAKVRGQPIAIRLVKGAYWDHETIQANQNQWPHPLFTHKVNSDANYEKLSRLLLDNVEFILPAFASHNVRSLAQACCYARSNGISSNQFELQMLYGMADPIAKTFAELGYLIRLYVPLGEMLPGMGYLVRRLLENTSNESFLRHTFYEDSEMQQLLQQPIFVQDL